MSCIFCSTSDDLNTEMTIKLDNGDKVTVYVCDDHAINATVQAVKDAHASRQNQIDQLIEQAKKLGLHVAEQELPVVVSKPTAASNAVQPANIGQMTPQIEESTGKLEKKPVVITPGSVPSNDMDGDDIVSTEVIDSSKGMKSVGGASGGHMVDSHGSHDFSSLEDQLPEDVRRGKIKMEMMEGRGGQPLAIPKKRMDGTGTTRINIVKTGGDTALQERFKTMASSENPADFRNGYQSSSRDCPICKGTGFTTNAGEEIQCPKCDGVGIIY